jgi:hypothetical protein
MLRKRKRRKRKSLIRSKVSGDKGLLQWLRPSLDRTPRKSWLRRQLKRRLKPSSVKRCL